MIKFVLRVKFKMQNRNYKINKDKFLEIYKKAEEIFGNICLIELFCKRYYNVDDFGKVKPLIKYTIYAADKLYCELIDIKDFHTLR